jgi:hypothetical protein
MYTTQRLFDTGSGETKSIIASEKILQCEKKRINELCAAQKARFEKLITE